MDKILRASGARQRKVAPPSPEPEEASEISPASTEKKSNNGVIGSTSVAERTDIHGISRHDSNRSAIAVLETAGRVQTPEDQMVGVRSGKPSGKPRIDPRAETVLHPVEDSLAKAASPPPVSTPFVDFVDRAGTSADRHEANDSSPTRSERLDPAPFLKAESAADTGVLAAAPSLGSSIDFRINTESHHPMRELFGRIEKATTQTIAGWVWDPRTPYERIRLELLDEQRRLAVAVADGFRPELVPLGCGDGRYGFNIALADGLLSRDRHILILRCADTGVAMPGSPIAVERREGRTTTGLPHLGASVTKGESTFRAYIDKITDTELLGWITCPARPRDRHVVVLKEGKRILARAVASQFRGDLVSAGIGDGCYAFVIELPPSLSDGRKHLLDVIEEESGFSITAQPIQWSRGALIPGSTGDTQSVALQPVTGRIKEARRQTSEMEHRAHTSTFEARGHDDSIQDKYHFCLHGPMKGEYSLAIVNRHFASALVRAGQEVFLSPQEADLMQDAAFLRSPELLTRLLGRRPRAGQSISSVNDWPIPDRVSPGTSVIHCCAWEESIIPFEIAARLSSFDLVTTTSSFVTRCLRNSGVTSPLSTIGNGVDHIPRPGMQRLFREQDASKPFVFLHVSSCFPRKGIDVLLDAYFSEFSSFDNVRLIIKTFDNPHNRELRQQIAARRSCHESPPALDVRIESLGDDAYYQLFLDADCLVAPSFGEGFLLPAAEALLNNVPVIATNWGGHLDFCSGGTAWLIDADLEKSTSHVASAGSLWAIPSREHLRRLLREMTQLSVPERASRVARGQQILEQNFRWIDVARRYLDALAPILLKQEAARSDLERPSRASVGKGNARLPEVRHASSNGTHSEPIRIDQITKSAGRHAVISTFGQRCGIATFTAELLEAASSQAEIVGVVTEIADEAAPPDAALNTSFPVQRVWRRHFSSVADTINAALRLRPDHVLVEHHPGIFGWDMLSAIVRGLSGKARTTIELHSCEGNSALIAALPGLQFANRVITHNGPDYMLLAKLFGTDKTSLIPHGIGASLALRDRVRDSHAAEGIRLASFGLAGPHKGFHKVIEVMALLRQTGLDISYHLLTSFNSEDRRARDYLKYCIELAHQLGVQDHLHIDFRFLSIDELLTRLRACDIGVMAYDDDVTEGASGATRLMLRANLPLVLSGATIFDEFRGVGVTVDGKRLALAREIYRLVLSPDRQRQILERQATFAALTSWRNVAKMVFGCFDAY